MQADHEDKPYRSRKGPERRLAFEIALGIWLGGCALLATSSVAWWLILNAMVRGLRFGG